MTADDYYSRGLLLLSKPLNHTRRVTPTGSRPYSHERASSSLSSATTTGLRQRVGLVRLAVGILHAAEPGVPRVMAVAHPLVSLVPVEPFRLREVPLGRPRHSGCIALICRWYSTLLRADALSIRATVPATPSRRHLIDRGSPGSLGPPPRSPTRTGSFLCSRNSLPRSRVSPRLRSRATRGSFACPALRHPSRAARQLYAPPLGLVRSHGSAAARLRRWTHPKRRPLS